MTNEEDFENQPDCEHKKLQCSCGRYFSMDELISIGYKQCELDNDLATPQEVYDNVELNMTDEKDLCEHGLVMRCPKCAYNKGFKAGQKSFPETENQIYETQREQLQYEREQARKETLEEVEDLRKAIPEIIMCIKYWKEKYEKDTKHLEDTYSGLYRPMKLKRADELVKLLEALKKKEVKK